MPKRTVTKTRKRVTEKRWATVDADGVVLWISDKGETRDEFDRGANPLGRRLVRVTLSYTLPAGRRSR